jgi:predicted nucleic acid-binding protein
MKLSTEEVRTTSSMVLSQLLREARRADGLESELKTLTRELESRVEVKLAEHEARTAGILQEHRTYENKLRAEIDKLHKEAASKLRKAEVRPGQA